MYCFTSKVAITSFTGKVIFATFTLKETAMPVPKPITARVKVFKPVRLLPPVEIVKKLDRFDVSHPWVQERIHYFAVDTTEKILRNMKVMQVSPKRSDRNYTGSLERSIHWTIVSNAGGDMALVEFYYLFYGRYVEMAASGWLTKGWGHVGKGDVPEMTSKSGVWVTTNDRVRPWKAKPFINSEIKREAKKLGRRLAAQFAYAGGMQIFQTFVTEASVKEGGMSIMECADGFWDYIQNRTKDNVTLL